MAGVDVAYAKTGGEPIDRAHLRQMTFADQALEREVLTLFERQAATMMERLRKAEIAQLPALAHALKGSARGIGAWRVADAAIELERRPDDMPVGETIGRLNAALSEARAAIAQILGPK